MAKERDSFKEQYLVEKLKARELKRDVEEINWKVDQFRRDRDFEQRSAKKEAVDKQRVSSRIRVRPLHTPPHTP